MYKQTIFSAFICICFALPGCSQNEEVSGSEACSGTVEYELRIDLAWNSTGQHPNAPSGAHFSPFFGTTHALGSSFWQTGELASEGIVRMAEGGTMAIRGISLEK